jgi:hypothetical protein
MIRRAFEAIRARREKRRADAYALESYRLQMQDALRWLAEFPDVCLLVETMQTFAGDKNVTAYDSVGLRAVMRTMREAKFQDALKRRVLVNTIPTLQEAIRYGGYLVAAGNGERQLVRFFFGVLADQVEHMIANDSVSRRYRTNELEACIARARAPLRVGLWTGESTFLAFSILSEEVEYAIRKAGKTT